MGYAEVIYETGSKSVVSYEDKDALKASLAEQQRRAISGESGGPAGHAAERIKRVLIYKEHPGDFNESCLISAEDAKTLVDHVAQGGQVSIWEVIAALRGYVSPLVPKAEGNAHSSMYLAEQSDELAMDWLDFNAKDGE